MKQKLELSNEICDFLAVWNVDHSIYTHKKKLLEQKIETKL